MLSGPLEHVFDRAGVELPEHLGLIVGALHRATREDGGEVEQRARDGRAWDAVDELDVARQERAAGVGVDAGALAARPARRDDVDE